jgi:putative transposase
MYKRKNIRLKYFDYAENGYYFVTICTKNKTSFLRHIENDQMCLSSIGEIAKNCWLQIPTYFPDVLLDEYIIMPNHVHGIIIIDRDYKQGRATIHRGLNQEKDMMNHVPTFQQSNPMNTGSLSEIIRSFKAKTSFLIHKDLNVQNFQWQPRFYEHIITNDKELKSIQEYIENNPLKWEFDKENMMWR